MTQTQQKRAANTGSRDNRRFGSEYGANTGSHYDGRPENSVLSLCYVITHITGTVRESVRTHMLGIFKFKYWQEEPDEGANCLSWREAGWRVELTSTSGYGDTWKQLSPTGKTFELIQG